MATQFINDLLLAAQPAINLINSDFYRVDQSFTEEKTDFQDIVTETDKKTQQLLISGIRQLAPKYNFENLGFIAEETDDNLKPAEHTFIIDPIDGTTNFASKLSLSVISIGYSQNNQLQAGLIIQPFTGEYWWAEKGQGAWYVFPDKQINRALKILPRKLSDSLIAIHLNGLEHADWQFSQYQKLYPSVRGERLTGSVTLDLAHTAENIYQGVLNGKNYLWDIAAAWVILEESGGVIVTQTNQPLIIDWSNPKLPTKIMAGHPEMLSQIFNCLNSN